MSANHNNEKPITSPQEYINRDPAKFAALAAGGYFRIFGRTWKLLFKHLLTFMKIWLPPMVLLELGTSYAMYASGPFAIFILIAPILALYFAASAILSPAIVYALIENTQRDSYPSISAAYKWGLIQSPKMFRASIYYLLIVAAGFICLILPAVYLATVYMLYVIVISVDGKATKRPFRKSRLLIKKRFFRSLVFFSFFVVLLISDFVISYQFELLSTNWIAGALYSSFSGFLIDVFGIIFFLLVFLKWTLGDENSA